MSDHKKLARHHHEAGAPLTSDCDTWCECKYKGYVERLEARVEEISKELYEERFGKDGLSIL